MVTEYGKLIDPEGKMWRMRAETPSRSGSFGERFVQVFPEKMMELARDRTASPSCLAVFTWCLSRLNFKSFEMISQAEIGLELGLSQATIGRALRDLCERGFMERQGAGPRQTWRITPKGAWFGTAASYQKTARDRGENPAGLKLVHDRDPGTVDIEEYLGRDPEA